MRLTAPSMSSSNSDPEPVLHQEGVLAASPRRSSAGRVTAWKSCVRKKSWAARFVSRTSSVIRVRRWLDSLLMSLATICAADAAAAVGGVDGEVEDVQLVLVQLVDHEADDLLAVLGDHADAVALAEAAEEIFLGPGVLEAVAARSGRTSGMSRRIIQRIWVSVGAAVAIARPVLMRTPPPYRAAAEPLPAPFDPPGAARKNREGRTLPSPHVPGQPRPPAAAPPSGRRWPRPGYSL